MPVALRIIAIVMTIAIGWVLTSAIGLLISLPVPLEIIMTICFAGGAWLMAGLLADRQVEREARKDTSNDLS
jgi:uncharacterized protein (DUF2062 family)